MDGSVAWNWICSLQQSETLLRTGPCAQSTGTSRWQWADIATHRLEEVSLRIWLLVSGDGATLVFYIFIHMK